MSNNPWDSISETSSKSNSNDGKFSKISEKVPFNFNNFDKIKNLNISIFILFFLVLYLLSGFFVVKPDEEALITRFEKFSRIEREGLHYKLPMPFEDKYVVSVSLTRTLKIGNDSDKNTKHLILTKDENIVDTNFEIQWKINNLKDYMFNIKNPDINLIQVSESVLRENLGQFNLSEILTNKRQEIELLNKEHIQRILNEYGAGIEIISVQMLRVDPPKQVIDAFRDVQTARVDKESEINNAMVYYNTKIPEARGAAKEIVTKAEAIALEKVNKAKGEAILFDKIYSQYKNSPATTRVRIYLEQMEDIFKKSDVTIVDADLKNIFLNTSRQQEKPEKSKNELSQEQEVSIKNRGIEVGGDSVGE